MIQENLEPYEKLLQFLESLNDEQDVRLIKKDSKICFSFGITQNEFEKITDYYPNNEIKTYRYDDFLTVKRITRQWVKFYMINLPYTVGNGDETTENFKMSMIILSKILESKTQKIHYLIKVNQEGQAIQNQIGLFDDDNITKFTIIDGQNSIQKKKTVNHIHIKNATFLKMNYQIIEELSCKYIQQKFNQFLFELDISSQLNTIYKYLDFCSQLPKNSSDFKSVFKDYLLKLRQIFQDKQKQFEHGIIPSLDLFIIFGQAIQENSENINNIIQVKQLVNNHSVQDFCKSAQIEIQNVNFKFEFNFQKFQQITELLKKTSISYKIYWFQLSILSIFDLINYVLTYYDTNEDQDFDLLLRKFQPLENKKNEKAVFMFGLTKVGKSTLTSVLQDPQNVERKEINGYHHYHKKNNQDQFSIELKAYSNIQRKVELLNLDGFDFLDCPGLNDTNEQFRIINSYNISKYLNQYKQIILVIVIDSQRENIFLQNFKDTFKYLRAFGQENFQNQEFKPLFILTFIEPNAQGQSWIDNFCGNDDERNDIIYRAENQNFLREFEIFFQAYREQRVIQFPSPICDFKLSDLKNRILTTANNIQQSFQNNTFKLDQNDIHKQELEKFKNILEKRVKFTIDFFFKKLLTSIIMNKEIKIEKKKQDLKLLIDCIELNQDKGIYKFSKQITKFGLENNYLVSCLDLQRFENFDNGFRIVSINYQTYIDDCVKQVKEISKIITKIAKLINCGIISLLFISKSYTYMIPLLSKILIFSATTQNLSFNTLIKKFHQFINEELQKKILKDQKILQ